MLLPASWRHYCTPGNSESSSLTPKGYGLKRVQLRMRNLALTLIITLAFHYEYTFKPNKNSSAEK